MAEGRLTPDQANFRKALVTRNRCGGYPSALVQPCSMFLPFGDMLQGNCSAVCVPQNTTDDEHTCDLWAPRTSDDDNQGDTTGYYDGDADDFRRSLEQRTHRRLW